MISKYRKNKTLKNVQTHIVNNQFQKPYGRLYDPY